MSTFKIFLNYLETRKNDAIKELVFMFHKKIESSLKTVIIYGFIIPGKKIEFTEFDIFPSDILNFIALFFIVF